MFYHILSALQLFNVQFVFWWTVLLTSISNIEAFSLFVESLNVCIYTVNKSNKCKNWCIGE